MQTRILIIDDEPQIRKLLSISLSNEGYDILEAETGSLGIALAANHQPDLILLDMGLPDMDGLDVLKELRSWYEKPVLILSVMDDESRIVKALDDGANDYLTKPYRAGELFARIRAALKQNRNEQPGEPLFAKAGIEIDFVTFRVSVEGTEVQLTHTEYSLMRLFAKYEGRALTHRFILKEIWGVGHQQDLQYLRVFVASLRKKLEPDPANPVYIRTLNGIGYRFL